mgnify:CR=1 FL=1
MLKQVQYERSDWLKGKREVFNFGQRSTTIDQPFAPVNGLLSTELPAYAIIFAMVAGAAP